MSDIKLENRSSPYPLSRLSANIEPVNQQLALSEVGKTMSVVLEAKLKVIQQQILHLQEEAQNILDAAEEDMRLHSAVCRFIKRPGHTYHLYKRHSAESDCYFSLISPEEWGNPPHEYVGSYKLLHDMSWARIVT